MLLSLQAMIRAETKLAVELATAVVGGNNSHTEAASSPAKMDSAKLGPAKSGFAPISTTNSSLPTTAPPKVVKMLSRSASSRELRESSDSPTIAKEIQYPPVNELRTIIKRLWEMKEKIPQLDLATG